MDLKRLNYFIHVAELGSFTKAGIALGLEQSVLSRHVRALEQEFGVLLLHRDGRGVRVTEAGALVLDRSRLILAEISGLSSELSAITGEPSGTIRFGVPPTVTETVIAAPLETMAEEYPKLVVEVIEAATPTLQERLMDGDVDLALLYESPSPRTVAAERLIEEELLLGCPGKSRLGGADPLAFSQLADIPLALPRRSHGLRTIIDAAAKRAGTSLSIAYEADRVSTILELVKGGRCYTILPASFLAPPAAAGGVEFRSLTEPDLRRTLLLAISTKNSHSSASSSLMTAVKQTITEQVHDGTWPAKLLFD